MRHCRLHVLFILAIVLGTRLTAQDQPGASLEASAGLSSSRGGTYRDRTGIALDATLGWRIEQTASPATILALSGGVQGNSAVADICVRSRRVGGVYPHTRCSILWRHSLDGSGVEGEARPCVYSPALDTTAPHVVTEAAMPSDYSFGSI